MSQGVFRAKRPLFDEVHDAFRQSVRDFLKAEAVPRAAQWQADGIIDRDFWRKAAAQNLVGFNAPVEFGGMGLEDFRFNVILDEEVVRAGVGTDAFTLTNDIVGPYLWDLATEEQKKRWLPEVTSGEKVIAIAMTEPSGGTDLRGMKSVARPTEGGYLLSGSKTFITSGIQADLVVVAAQIQQGGGQRIGLLVVEATQPGFSRGRKLEKIGRRAQDTAELFFDEVFVPHENVLGGIDEGFALMMRNLPTERLSMAVTAMANVEHVLQQTLQYVQERTAFGQPVGSFQANRFTLAELVTEARAGRAFVDDCIRRALTGDLPADEAAGAKYLATDLEWKVMDACLQLHGGYGYMDEYEIATRWRDARVQRIYGGTNELMKEIVGRALGL